MLEPSSLYLRALLRWSNVPPLVTILGAGLALALAAASVIRLTIAENLIIGLLALLGVDALTERLVILGRIEDKLKSATTGQPLRGRSQIPPVESFVSPAVEILIIAISGISIIHQNLRLFAEKIEAGCKVRIALLDPQSPTVGVIHDQYGMPIAVREISASLEALCRLQTHGELCEIRSLKIFLPFSAVAINLGSRSGAMVVEFHAYKKTFGERPHVVFTAAENPNWFNFYREQLEAAWADASPWKREAPNPGLPADA